MRRTIEAAKHFEAEFSRLGEGNKKKTHHPPWRCSEGALSFRNTCDRGPACVGRDSRQGPPHNNHRPSTNPLRPGARCYSELRQASRGHKHTRTHTQSWHWCHLSLTGGFTGSRSAQTRTKRRQTTGEGEEGGMGLGEVEVTGARGQNDKSRDRS